MFVRDDEMSFKAAYSYSVVYLRRGHSRIHAFKIILDPPLLLLLCPLTAHFDDQLRSLTYIIILHSFTPSSSVSGMQKTSLSFNYL